MISTSFVCHSFSNSTPSLWFWFRFDLILWWLNQFRDETRFRNCRFLHRFIGIVLAWNHSTRTYKSRRHAQPEWRKTQRDASEDMKSSEGHLSRRSIRMWLCFVNNLQFSLKKQSIFFKYIYCCILLRICDIYGGVFSISYSVCRCGQNEYEYKRGIVTKALSD